MAREAVLGVERVVSVFESNPVPRLVGSRGLLVFKLHWIWARSVGVGGGGRLDL